MNQFLHSNWLLIANTGKQGRQKAKKPQIVEILRVTAEHLNSIVAVSNIICWLFCGCITQNVLMYWNHKRRRCDTVRNDWPKNTLKANNPYKDSLILLPFRKGIFISIAKVMCAMW